MGDCRSRTADARRDSSRLGTCKSSYPAALVSGHPEKARQLASVHGVDPQAIYSYEDFDRIRDNGRIDVVYIVLPNSLHAEYTIRALQAGKHVLCEKPMAASLAECEAMIKAAGDAGRTLGVAYRLHYEPMNLAVMEMCRKREFGQIKTFTASNCQNVKAPNIRLSGPLGGGPVGDVGIYCINAARYTSVKSRWRRSLCKGSHKKTAAFEKSPNRSVFSCVIRPEPWQPASAPSELLAARATKCSARMGPSKWIPLTPTRACDFQRRVRKTRFRRGRSCSLSPSISSPQKWMRFHGVSWRTSRSRLQAKWACRICESSCQ
jgi:hypothetical protein